MRILPVILIVGALAVVALIAWWTLRPKAIVVRTVLTREVTRASGDRTVLNASGYVTARREATVSSKITGKVVEVLVEEGMKVKEGDVLARLDETNVKASLLMARAQLASAKALMAETRVRLKEAEQELQRQTDLTKARWPPRRTSIMPRPRRSRFRRDWSSSRRTPTWRPAPSRSGSNNLTTP